jgi:hypothetical protein
VRLDVANSEQSREADQPPGAQRDHRGSAVSAISEISEVIGRINDIQATVGRYSV